MAHQLVYKDWQSPSGRWYCNDVSDLAGVSGLWYTPARMMGMTPAAYVEWVIKEFKPDDIFWNGKIFFFSWSKYIDCHRFVLRLNKEARNRGFIC